MRSGGIKRGQRKSLIDGEPRHFCSKAKPSSSYALKQMEARRIYFLKIVAFIT